ncbi:hypothetical protein ACLB1N_26520 [Escherichia coli]
MLNSMRNMEGNKDSLY